MPIWVGWFRDEVQNTASSHHYFIFLISCNVELLSFFCNFCNNLKRNPKKTQHDDSALQSKQKQKTQWSESKETTIFTHPFKFDGYPKCPYAWKLSTATCSYKRCKDFFYISCFATLPPKGIFCSSNVTHRSEVLNKDLVKDPWPRIYQLPKLLPSISCMR